MSSILISTDTLATWIAEDRAVTLIDVRWYLAAPGHSRAREAHEEYLAGHLPGAHWVDLETELADPPGVGGRHPLPDRERFAAAMRRCGVCADRPVVVMDHGNLHAAARLWWLLVDAGHGQVYVLDGGVGAWQEQRRPLTDTLPGPTSSDFDPMPGHLPQVSTEDVAQGNLRLWDVRSAERYRGEQEPVDHVAGHIPGARNLPDPVVREGRLLSVEQLRELFSEVRTGDVVHCGSGISASTTVLALEVAGIRGVALYPGSWSAWITDPTRPVAG